MIYIDARMIESSGIGTYIKNLSLNNDLYNYYLGDKQTLEKYCDKDNIIEYNSKIYGIKEQLKFPYNKIAKNDILHCPHYNVPIFFRGKLVVTIHDITHIVYPEYLPNKLAFYYAKFMIWLATKKSKHIFTVSDYTKQDLVKYFKVNPEKITVTYNAVSDIFKPLDKKIWKFMYDKYSIPKDKKIILYVGNKKPHKNLERLLYAFNQIENKENCVLVFTGKGFGNYTKLEEVTKELNLEKYVIHTGIVPEEELVYLYNMADLFVFPSLYEGFGIPPLEAMACGTPVIASNASSVPEVVGNAAYMINPENIDEMSKAMYKVLSDENLQNELIAKGLERVKLFSWNKCKERTKKVLNNLR